jgi:glycosyltransferase involved in cell wall biosynthesis
LAQTFEDYELIICDNASTDNTEAICPAYAASDKRIRYYRNQKNFGCARNFNRVLSERISCYISMQKHLRRIKYLLLKDLVKATQMHWNRFFKKLIPKTGDVSVEQR